jgi:DNA-binding NarL/FixJ family response regulator
VLARVYTPARRTATRLTACQQEVAMLVGPGLTNRQIAERLGVTEHAASHVERILDKLGVGSRVQMLSGLRSTARSRRAPPESARQWSIWHRRRP